MREHATPASTHARPRSRICIALSRQPARRRVLLASTRSPASTPASAARSARATRSARTAGSTDGARWSTASSRSARSTHARRTATAAPRRSASAERRWRAEAGGTRTSASPPSVTSTRTVAPEATVRLRRARARYPAARTSPASPGTSAIRRRTCARPSARATQTARMQGTTASGSRRRRAGHAISACASSVPMARRRRRHPSSTSIAWSQNVTSPRCVVTNRTPPSWETTSTSAWGTREHRR